MKKRQFKKLVKRGVCPLCRCDGGVSYWNLVLMCRVNNFCSNCNVVCGWKGIEDCISPSKAKED